MYKIAVISLGCNKNLVDSEIMVKYLTDLGHVLVTDPSEAELIFVNTCGFIEDAKTEAINTIFEMFEYKKDRCKGVFATGCLAKRYHNELCEQIPELDGVLGVYDYSRLSELLKAFARGERYVCVDGKASYLDHTSGRILSTPRYSAYLKIADGCSNRCHYCAIPSIRGDYCSRSMESLLEEARWLYEAGVRELLVTAQDSTRYGEDQGENRFIELLMALEAVGFTWIRILYAYPSRVTKELLEYIDQSNVICHYLDIPLQHTQDTMLKAMNRHYDQDKIKEIYNCVRCFETDWALRTTVICGYPGETGADFNKMLSFFKKYPFELLGAFAYSAEEGTVGAQAAHQCRQSTKETRADSIMLQQSETTNQLIQRYIGKTIKVLIEGFDVEHHVFVGRSEFQAPEVDGKVFVSAKQPLAIGDFYNCVIDDAFGYDLYGSVQE